MRGSRGRRFRDMALICLLLWAHVTCAAEAERLGPLLKARFVPDSARVGTMVDLVLDYRLPKGAQLPPKPRIKGLEGFSVEGLQKGPADIRVRLLVDRLSEFKTGPLSLSYLDSEGKTAFLDTGPVALTVQSNLGERPEEARMEPICGIIPARSRLMTSLIWVLAALCACAAGAGLFFWLKRRRARGGLQRVRIPPHIAAEREIRELASQQIFEKGHVKEFYFRFSVILRRYLEALRGFPAAEYTTQEIALSVQAPEDRRILPLLQDADMVKFADHKPTPARKSDEIDQALAYIRETGTAFETGPDDHRPRGIGWARGLAGQSGRTGP